MRAFTPSNPEPQDEAWYAFLTDPANNQVLAWTKVTINDPTCLSRGQREGAGRSGVKAMVEGVLLIRTCA